MFAENLKTGRTTESHIAKWLMARGHSIMPARAGAPQHTERHTGRIFAGGIRDERAATNEDGGMTNHLTRAKQKARRMPQRVNKRGY